MAVSREDFERVETRGEAVAEILVEEDDVYLYQ